MVVPVQLEDAEADIVPTQGRLEGGVADGDALEFHRVNLIFREAPEGQDLITCFRVRAERERAVRRYNSKQLGGTLFDVFTFPLMFAFPATVPRITPFTH